ncbi:MAG TPA: HDIG domain-containing protein [Gemmatimonadaceae bacterium]|nr:HDIG domain-containing protein [Gemmatimonadaceae bacterium]
MPPDDSPDRVNGDPPGGQRRERAVRIALVLGLTLFTYLLFPTVPAANFPVYDVGALATRNVIAPFAFRVMKDSAELARERDALARTVDPVFVLVPTALDSSERQVQAFARALATAYAAGTHDSASMQRATAGFPLVLGNAEVQYLADHERRTRMFSAVEQAYGRWLASGVAVAGALDGVSGDVVLRRNGTERARPAESIRTYGEFASLAHALQPDSREVGRTLYDHLLAAFFHPTIVADSATTQARRAQLVGSVPASKFEVRAGEEIVGANQVVSVGQHERLVALRDQMDERRGAIPDIRRGVGAVLFDLILLTLLGLTVLIFRPHVYGSTRSLVVIATVTGLVILGGALVSRMRPLHPELVPVGIAAIVISALFDRRIAMIVAVLLAALIGGQSVFRGTNALYVQVIGGAVAAYSVRAVRTRQQTYTWIVVIALAYSVSSLAVGLTLDLPNTTILRSAAFGSLNAVISVLVALLLLPLAERYTGVETDLTLLEWSDLNRPLMQRLSLEAPGTFAHSMQIASLAEAACRAVGANALLARVGAYYHDIGKLVKPQYFVENQAKGHNPHDQLTPLQSAQVIRNHVRNGLQLAEDGHVPRVLRNFIAEHHGTGVISYFLERARKAGGEAPREEDYRYPGPIPQSVETAVLMLADGAEASVRVLNDPTPQRIHEVVEHIVRQRLEAGQLRDAPLTLRDMELVKAEFTRGLSGMHHSRVDYPAASGGVSATFAQR